MECSPCRCSQHSRLPLLLLASPFATAFRGGSGSHRRHRAGPRGEGQLRKPQRVPQKGTPSPPLALLSPAGSLPPRARRRQRHRRSSTRGSSSSVGHTEMPAVPPQSWAFSCEMGNKGSAFLLPSPPVTFGKGNNARGQKITPGARERTGLIPVCHNRPPWTGRSLASSARSRVCECVCACS